MKMTAQEYARRVRRIGPHSPLGLDCLWAFWRGRRHLPAGRSAAPELPCHGRGSRPCRHPDQLQPDRALGGAYHAGLVPEAGRKGRGRVAGAHHRLCQCGGQRGHRVQGRGTGAGYRGQDVTIAGPVIVYGTLAAAVYGAVLWVLGMAGVPVLS